MTSAIATPEARLGADWSAIRAAAAKTEEVVNRLGTALADLDDASFSVVVTGSLGRGEATAGSDADWILLVDGRADPRHAMIASEIANRIRKVVTKEVGRTGTFGGIVASHELVHYIAGTRDSNENLTRRILLLSESHALINAGVRERVIQNVLARYVVYDRSVQSRSGTRQTVPRRRREGWGIRNVKLSFPRKLLFIWGLLASFAGDLFAPAELHEMENDDEYFHALAELIRSLAAEVADARSRRVRRRAMHSRRCRSRGLLPRLLTPDCARPATISARA